MKREEKEPKFIHFEKLRKKGFDYKIHRIDIESWKRAIKLDLGIPKSYIQLRRLGRILYNKKIRRSYYTKEFKKPERGILTPFFEECFESIENQFLWGLKNPFLTSAQLDAIEADMDADMPNFENTKETTHFVLHWTNNSADANDNIADESIIDETATDLETAWTKYDDSFSEQPNIPIGDNKINIYFFNMGSDELNGSAPTDLGIKFNAHVWVNYPGRRKPVSAHELFHRLQFNFGYRTVYTPISPFKWFSEGTASWAEVFVWKRVSRPIKLETLFENPDANLYDAEYQALPFWLFFDTRQRDSISDNPMNTLLQQFQTHGDMQKATEDTIASDWPPNNVYNQLDSFFALFSRERLIGAWRQTPTGGQPYAQILDPDDNVINPTLTVFDVHLSSGDTYTNTIDSVPQLGSDYYRFILNANTDGKILTISSNGSTLGDFSYYVVWEKNGRFALASFPSGANEDYGFSETIDLNKSDSIVLITSGRGTGGTYTIDASVS